MIKTVAEDAPVRFVGWVPTMIQLIRLGPVIYLAWERVLRDSAGVAAAAGYANDSEAVAVAETVVPVVAVEEAFVDVVGQTEMTQLQTELAPRGLASDSIQSMFSGVPAVARFEPVLTEDSTLRWTCSRFE